MRPAVIARAGDSTFLRYGLASVVALGADMGGFLLLLHAGMASAAAAACSYCGGIVIHWLVSSRAVFANVAAAGPARSRQKALFVATALLGLALTTAIVALATCCGVDPRIAKLAAVFASFLATWALRHRVVFARAPALR